MAHLHVAAVRQMMTGPAAGSTTATAVEFRDVSQRFGTREMVQALVDVELIVEPASFVAIVGPSGCGKSTLLNLASGVLRPTSGRVLVSGSQVTGIRHDVGYMFQRDTLLPWKTALEAVALPLRFRGMKKAQASEIAGHWLSRVGLLGFERHYPHQLSGGMKKRLALATVFAYSPPILLMDEPFSALDVQTRNLMEDELLGLWQEQKMTVLFVTHDLEEAIGLADRVVVMTRRPGAIKSDYVVDLERPRSISEIRTSPGFIRTYERIWMDLRDEVRSTYVAESRVARQ